MNKVSVIMLMAIWMVTSTAQAQSTTIKKVSANEVKAMIDKSTEPTIFNFWATWCGPCIREIPWFDSIIAAKKSGVKLVLVSIDFKSAYPNELAAFVKKKGYKGEVIYLTDTDPEKYIPIIEPKWGGAIPASIFVNNSTKYYQLFNEQIPKQRFEMELDKLEKSKEN